MKFLGVDLSLIFSMAWEANEGKEFSAAFRRTVDVVTAARVGFDRCMLAIDSGPSFRKVCPEYKANRKDRGEPYREQLKRTIERLVADGCVPIVAPAIGTFPGTGAASYAEADDVMGWAVEEYSKRVSPLSEEAMVNWSFAILSDDSDMEQLIDDAACVLVIKSQLRGGAYWTESTVIEKRGVNPTQIADVKALAGDGSDDYKGYTGPQKPRDPAYPDKDPGCNPGVGPAHAAFLIQRFGGALSVFDAGATPEERAAKWEAAGVKPGIRATLERHGRGVAEKGLFLATIRRELPGLDFSTVMAEPVVAKISRQAEYTMPPDDGPCSMQEPMAMASHHEERAPLVTRGIDVFALQPKGLAALESLAKTLYDSRLYSQYANWQAIMAVAIEANERGIPVASAVRQAHVIQGKVGWPAAFLAGLILSSGKAEVFELVSTDASQATIAYKRRGRPEGTFRVTVEDAKDDGQLDKWVREKKSVRVMLTWKCFREGARAIFPDVCSGMHEVEELGAA